MIRRVASVLLLALGGWLLTAELVAATFDVEAGYWDSAIVVGIFLPIAAIPLLAGASLTPGECLRELGLTVLISAGIAIAMAACLAAVMLDPKFVPYMPPLRALQFDLVFGFANWLSVIACGWWLYRRPPKMERRASQTAHAKVDFEGPSPVQTAVEPAIAQCRASNTVDRA